MFNTSLGVFMKQYLLPLAIASSIFAMAAAAHALSSDEYKAAKEGIEANYKVAEAKCHTVKDNAKDVCMKEAKGTEDVAKAELEQQYKPSPRNARKVSEEKANMTYEVAKEKCDDLSGDAKSACVNQAKANHEKAQAEIKAMKG